MCKCEKCINFRVFDDLDIIDDFQRKYFDGFCFSNNKIEGKGRPHSKGDWCTDFKWKCEQKNCKKVARWEIAFSKMLQNDSSRVLCDDTLDHTNYFCDKHFVELNRCENAIRFRLIGDINWLDFSEHDNLYVLQELVVKSHKLYIQEKFRKIIEFL